MARELGRTVVNSPLVKCAVAGNDPNVGRIVAAAGKFVGELDVNTSTKDKVWVAARLSSARLSVRPSLHPLTHSHALHSLPRRSLFFLGGGTPCRTDRREASHPDGR